MNFGALFEQLASMFTRAVAEISDWLGLGEPDSTSQEPGSLPAGILIGAVTDGDGLCINIYAEEVDGAVNMTVKVMEGVADLRGFYMDVGDSVAGVSVEGVDDRDLAIADEGVTTVGGRDNNMNGTGETFDIGMEIGTAGYFRDDNSEARFTLQGVELEDLDGLTFGVRATSVGEDRTDAVKLLGEFDIPAEEPPAEPPAETPAAPAAEPVAETPAAPPVTTPPVTPTVGGNFPQLPDDISSIVLYYNTPSGDITGDNYYAAKVDNVSWVVEDDLDLWLVDATRYLEVNDPNVQADTELLGVAITHGGTTDYYAMDGNSGADTAPASSLTPDTTVSYDMIMG
jgi:hypothetical protein